MRERDKTVEGGRIDEEGQKMENTRRERQIKEK